MYLQRTLNLNLFQSHFVTNYQRSYLCLSMFKSHLQGEMKNYFRHIKTFFNLNQSYIMTNLWKETEESVIWTTIRLHIKIKVNKFQENSFHQLLREHRVCQQISFPPTTSVANRFLSLLFIAVNFSFIAKYFGSKKQRIKWQKKCGPKFWVVEGVDGLDCWVKNYRS